MECTYVINVARNLQSRLSPEPRWTHYFRVELTGPEREAKEVHEDLTKRFPECKVTTSYWSCSGKDMGW